MSNRRVFRWGLFVAVLGAGLIYVASMMQDPDLVFSTSREVRTELSSETIDQSIRVLSNWPLWNRGVAEAQSMDLRGMAYPAVEQVLEPGSIVELTMKSMVESGKPIRLRLAIDRYAAGFLMRARLTGDSSTKISDQFDQLEWDIEFPEPTKIRLTVRARPASFRAKILCILAKPLVLVNLMIPDIQKLAELKQPHPLIHAPPFQR